MSKDVVVNGVEYKAFFSHFNMTTRSGSVRRRRATVAVLLMKDGKFSYGVAYFNPNDKFSKKEGAKQALEKASVRDLMPMEFSFRTPSRQFCAALLRLDLASSWAPLYWTKKAVDIDGYYW